MSETASNGASDRIVLTLPGTTRLRGVATMVLGGVGSRLDLPYEKVDDLQLAVLSVLAASDLETVTIDVEVHDDCVDVTVGPLSEGEAADEGLRRVLERLVDGVEASRGIEEPAATQAGALERAAIPTPEWITLRLEREDADAL
jgi:hypothetical protein